VTGSGENTYCRVCGVRADPGQVVCANCGAELPTTPNTVRTDLMERPAASARRTLFYLGLGLAVAVPALAAARIARRR